MPPNPTTTEVIRRAIESRLGDVFTALPAQVKAYDGATQTADLILVVRRPLPSGEESEPVYEDLPILPNVPVLFPRGGGGTVAITWPLEPGDHVLVIFTTWSVAGWRVSGQVSDPLDGRAHHPGSAVALPGLAPSSQPLSQGSTPALVLEGSEIRLGKDAADFLAIAPKVMANLNIIKDAISGAAVTAGDGGAAFKAAILSYLSTHPFQDVSASKAKAE